MNYGKYVIVDCPILGPRAILFDKTFEHRRMAFGGVENVISAGFFQVTNQGVFVFGGSESTGKKSRLEDVEILKKLFRWD